MIAQTPKPPYYVVVFTNLRTEVEEGYEETAHRMLELAAQEPGYLGVEYARNEIGLTLSYWSDLESIKKWKENWEHTDARDKGRGKWYEQFAVRIAKVERDYFFER